MSIRAVAYGKLPISREFVNCAWPSSHVDLLEHHWYGGLQQRLQSGAGASMMLRVPENANQAIIMVLMASEDGVGRSYPWAVAECWPWPADADGLLRAAYRAARLATLLAETSVAADQQQIEALCAAMAVHDAALETRRAWHALKGPQLAQPQQHIAQWALLRQWSAQGASAIAIEADIPLVLAACAASFTSTAAQWLWCADAAGGNVLAASADSARLLPRVDQPARCTMPQDRSLPAMDLAQTLQYALARRSAAEPWWQQKARVGQNDLLNAVGGV